MRTCALFLAGLSLGFAPAPFPRPNSVRDELKNLAGEWVRVICIVNSKPLSTSQTATAVISSKRIHYVGHPMSTREWSFVIDIKKKPKTLDMTGLAGGEKGVTYWGVYSLENDTLTIHSCKGATQSARPVDFTGSKPGVLIEIFKRQKR